MNRFQILACATIALGAAASAQNAPKPVSRGDYLKIVDGRFNNADTNHDGFVSKAEMVAQQQRDVQQAKAALAKKLQDEFKRLDTNHDGKLSLEEFMAAAPAIRVGENADQMMQRLDTNHDGRMSAEEWRSPELAKFNRVDANHDGIVTPAEQQAFNKK